MKFAMFYEIPVPRPWGERSEYDAYKNTIEQAMCEVWQEVLDRDQVGVRDNFFSLGGDSILSIRVVGMLKGRGILVEIKDIFQHQTIEQLALQARRATELKLGELARLDEAVPEFKPKPKGPPEPGQTPGQNGPVGAPSRPSRARSRSKSSRFMRYRARSRPTNALLKSLSSNGIPVRVREGPLSRNRSLIRVAPEARGIFPDRVAAHPAAHPPRFSGSVPPQQRAPEWLHEAGVAARVLALRQTERHADTCSP